MEPVKAPAPLVIISSSPYIHCGSTVSAAMRDVLLSLTPTLAAAVYFFGWPALSVILTCCLTAVVCEVMCQKIMQRPITVGDGSALLTGLLLAFCLPPQLSLGLAAFGSFCAIVIGKQVFGGLGSNIFNPAHLGRAILLASFPAQMTTWTMPWAPMVTAAEVAGPAAPYADAVSTATPLAALRMAEGLWQRGQDVALPSLSSLFWGNVGGSLGETCVPALLLGGLYLLWRGHIDWRIPAGYIGSVVAITAVYGWLRDYPAWFSVYHLFAGGLIIGAFFMATDWVTSPITKKGRLIYALGLGILTALIRLRGGYVEGVCYSILIMNMVTPLIDRYVTNVPFGGGARHD